jgi:hypothetical protein
MNRPGTSTMIAGHPVVCTPILLGTMGACYGCYQNSSLWPIALVMLFLLNGVVGASGARAKYLNWQREWNAMNGAPPTSEQSGRRTLPKWVGWIALILTVLYLLANGSDPTCRLALGWITVCTVGCGIAAWAMRGRAKHATGKVAPAAKSQPVTICVTAPLLPVPTLKNAYSAMPPYCRKVLGQTSAGAR